MQSAEIEQDDTSPGIDSVRGSSLTVITFRGQADRAQIGLLNHYSFFRSPHTADTRPLYSDCAPLPGAGAGAPLPRGPRPRPVLANYLKTPSTPFWGPGC